MPNMHLSVQVTRTSLGLSNLEINDHNSYYVADSFMGGQVAWQRTQVSSPWIDDEVTVNRRRGKVMENVVVEVLGLTQSALSANISTLIEAFNQDNFTLGVTIDGVQRSYQAEAADYQVQWNGPRQVAKQIQVVFSVPRSPIPTLGAF
jgi:hypothetical protein